MTSLFEKFGKPNHLFDSHCHLYSKKFDEDRAEVVRKAKENEVVEIFDISIDLETSSKSIEVSKEFDNVSSFIGIDPQIFIPGNKYFVGLDKDDNWFTDKFENLEKLILENRDEQTSVIENIMGLGETGMDFYWLKKLDQKLEVRGKKGEVLTSEEIVALSKSHQERLFRVHLELADKYHLPLSVHVRNAEKECLEIIKEYETVGVFHSYTGGFKVARSVINQGWGLGINAIATYENADDLRNVYRNLFSGVDIKKWDPETFYINGFYFETDAPYLNPGKNRTLRNEPANIKEIYEAFINLI